MQFSWKRKTTSNTTEKEVGRENAVVCEMNACLELRQNYLWLQLGVFGQSETFQCPNFSILWQNFSILKFSFEIKYILHARERKFLWVGEIVSRWRHWDQVCVLLVELKLHKFPLTKIIVKCVFVLPHSSFAVCTDVVEINWMCFLMKNMERG